MVRDEYHVRLDAEMIRQLARDCLAAGRVPEENNGEFVDYSNTPIDTRRECPNDRYNDVTVSTTSPVARLFHLKKRLGGRRSRPSSRSAPTVLRSPCLLWLSGHA